MPEHEADSLLNRHTKRRRVDIGVKRTVGSSNPCPAPSLLVNLNHTLTPLRHSAVRAASLLRASARTMSHASEQDLLDGPMGPAGPMSDGSAVEAKSNVLRKLLKRANSYEDAMAPFPGATIISQLLKNANGTGNGNSNNNSDGGFAGSGVSSVGSDAALQDEMGSNPSSRGDSPQGRMSPPFGRPEPERLSDEHVRAKRARVENIIRGMSHSPGSLLPSSSSGITAPSSSLSGLRSSSSSSNSDRDRERERERERERDRDRNGDPEGLTMMDVAPTQQQPCSPRENKRKQRLPQQQQQQQQSLLQQQSLQLQQRASSLVTASALAFSSSPHPENKRQERRQLKLQLDDMQKQLRQLQEKFFQIYDSTDSEGNDPGNDPDNDPDNLSEDSARSATPAADRSDNELSDLDPGHFLDRARALLREQALLERAKSKREVPAAGLVPGRGPGSMHAEGKQLAETLKQELNSAMTQVVDTVVKVFAKPPTGVPGVGAGGPHLQLYPALQPPPDHHRFSMNGDSPNLHTTNARLQCFGDVIIPSPLESFGGGVPPPSANDQTEALPLVVRKAPSEHQASAVGAHGGHHHPALHPSSLSASMGFSPPAFRPPFPLPLMGYPFQSHLGAPAGAGGYHSKDRGNSPDSMDLSRETTSLRTKMASGQHHLGGHRSCSPTHPGSTAEGLSLALIKSECGELQDMSDISPYSGSTIQEGLSPNHLKKAKLMFFYTRYPSSNMLKMFFADVKFNRCITSQLIKWFSNFREFYYIQMEKFARQAINDGTTTSDDISVCRDSELFRALNMHYNKANDFEVPERFLEVAQITLREFFNAIVAGKDVDPSWKKAIYKVICKLDAEVPEVFKSPNCLQELLHE